MSDVTRVPDICQSVCNQCVICDRISGARMCSKLNAKEIPRQCWSLFLWAPSAQLWCAPTSCTNVAMVLHIDLCWNTEISENALHITSCNSMSNSVQPLRILHTIFSFLKHLAINPNQERGLQSIFSTIVTTAKDVWIAPKKLCTSLCSLSIRVIRLSVFVASCPIWISEKPVLPASAGPSSWERKRELADRCLSWKSSLFRSPIASSPFPVYLSNTF